MKTDFPKSMVRGHGMCLTCGIPIDRGEKGTYVGRAGQRQCLTCGTYETPDISIPDDARAARQTAAAEELES